MFSNPTDVWDGPVASACSWAAAANIFSTKAREHEGIAADRIHELAGDGTGGAGNRGGGRAGEGARGRHLRQGRAWTGRAEGTEDSAAGDGARSAYPGLAPYCASRDGVKQLTMSLADDWGRHGILRPVRPSSPCTSLPQMPHAR